MIRTLALVLSLIAAPSAAGAAEVSIMLPPDHSFGTLKAGQGVETAQRNCVLCHSTDYIVTQPRGDLKQWDGVVTKMIKVFGAAINDPDAKAIAEYLAREYGK
jgi:sulfite dehydrogenase (cytochrome) subunit B